MEVVETYPEDFHSSHLLKDLGFSEQDYFVGEKLLLKMVEEGDLIEIGKNIYRKKETKPSVSYEMVEIGDCKAPDTFLERIERTIKYIGLYKVTYTAIRANLYCESGDEVEEFKRYFKQKGYTIIDGEDHVTIRI